MGKNKIGIWFKATCKTISKNREMSPEKHFTNLCVRIRRFRTETTIIDDKWAKGNLFQQSEDTLKILRQHISVRYDIKGIEQEDIWDYPIPALREAVLNALIHRNYFNIANFITIKVYDDHLWFSNPVPRAMGLTKSNPPRHQNECPDIGHHG